MNSPDQARVLAFIREKDGASEEEVRELLFPSPKYPASPATPEQIAAWNVARAEYARLSHGGENGEYSGGYHARASAVTIALSKAGLIREHNNGYNCYHFTPARITGEDIAAACLHAER